MKLMCHSGKTVRQVSQASVSEGGKCSGEVSSREGGEGGQVEGLAKRVVLE